MFTIIHQDERGLLFKNGNYLKTLKWSKYYYYWTGVITVIVVKIDLLQQQLNMAGQELMTEDKITLRLNFICQFKVINPLKQMEKKYYQEQIYILLQLILREYVGSLKLDELLQKKQEIGEFVLGKNPTLYRLKELEYIEKIPEKIHSISLSSRGGFLVQISKILGFKELK